MSEDCLTLNIWTPARSANQRLPVMVWLPGGSFVAGSGADPICDGEKFARKGVVLVTINYRVGLFGFLAHPLLTRESEHGASGNYGLMDQIAALRWVQTNIAAFGGDPKRVTVFGVSAGGASISLLLTSPLGRGLFQQAILESPGSLRPLASLEEAERAGRMLGDDLKAMRAISAEAVLARTGDFVPKVRGLTTPRVLRPIRDGWIINQEERAAYTAARFIALPMIIGGNLDEGSMFVSAWPVKTVGDYRKLIEQNFSDFSGQAMVAYPVAGDADVIRQSGCLFGDTQFNYGARGIARANSTRQPATFRYLFSRGPGDQGQAPRHGQEVPFVFGALSSYAADGWAFNERDEALSEIMMDAWVRFAAVGDPNGGTLPHWPAYNAGTDSYLEFGDDIRAGAGVRRTQMDFLDRFFDARSRAQGR